MNYNPEALLNELSFRTSRSGGKGGQNVNKVSSKVTLIWNVTESKVFDEQEKGIILEKLANRINKDGELLMDSSEDRSQLRNKDIVVERFLKVMEEAVKVEKKRIKTKIPKSVVLERLDRKKKQGAKKSDRNWRYNP
ncbi:MULTISPECIES: alternative ribosome rescue aminoacyl-tRNA hydrolase ArfB [Sphingobacterium]|uniref:Alternative ribosome rescue aminoacyl-tRNA hydrolase ArfB n=1 Tax=Sphingobacterium tenebrionis TaxID=3111775 RepID=A0ABU8I537_9SPHI|nr:alternative ribosome rescue aminoacyl-tRNA hydrolase ArfB [Sphingobacterium sp. 1.A.4]